MTTAEHKWMKGTRWPFCVFCTVARTVGEGTACEATDDQRANPWGEVYPNDEAIPEEPSQDESGDRPLSPEEVEGMRKLDVCSVSDLGLDPDVSRTIAFDPALQSDASGTFAVSEPPDPRFATDSILQRPVEGADGGSPLFDAHSLAPLFLPKDSIVLLQAEQFIRSVTAEVCCATGKAWPEASRLLEAVVQVRQRVEREGK